MGLETSLAQFSENLLAQVQPTLMAALMVNVCTLGAQNLLQSSRKVINSVEAIPLTFDLDKPRSLSNMTIALLVAIAAGFKVEAGNGWQAALFTGGTIWLVSAVLWAYGLKDMIALIPSAFQAVKRWFDSTNEKAE